MADIRLEAIERQDHPALPDQGHPQPVVVGQRGRHELIVAVEQVGDRPLRDHHPALAQDAVHLRHALVLAIAQGTDQGDDIEPKLVLRQDEATLTLRPVRSAMVLTTRGLTAPDMQPQVDKNTSVNVRWYAEKEEGNWLHHHRTYAGHRFAPLKEINKDTVKNLKVAWTLGLGGIEPGGIWSHGGLEGTPIAEDGFLYVTDGWGSVYKVDTHGGKGVLLWKMDPKTDRDWAGAVACCGVDNRGVALWNDKSSQHACGRPRRHRQGPAEPAVAEILADRSSWLSSGRKAARWIRVRLTGKVRSSLTCQPAPSRTSAAWLPAGTARASSARKTSMAAVETSGRTSAMPSPRSGQTAPNR